MIPTKRRLRPDNRCSIHQTSSPARSCIFFYAFSFIYRTCVSLLPQLYTKVASAKNGLFQKFNIDNGCPVKRYNKSMKCRFNWNAYCHLTIGKNPLRIEMWNIFTFKPTKLKSSVHQIDCKMKEESFNNTIFYSSGGLNIRENEKIKFGGLMFQTFYGGHGSSWAPKKDNFIHFRNFKITAN